MGRSILTVLLLLLFVQSRAQVDFTPAFWQDIDSSIRKKDSLRSLAKRVEALVPEAFKQENHLAVARCLDYQVRLRDLLTEDSLYFQNSRTVDSLLRLPGLPAGLEASLHLQMARRLIAFSRKYLRFNRKVYERRNQPVNYAAMSNPALLQLGREHFKAARKLASVLPTQPLADFLWMSSDPLQFLFSPSLYDILIAEQLLLEGKGYSYENPFSVKEPGIFKYTPDEFINRLGQFEVADSNKLMSLQLYNEWLQYHRANPSAHYLIETMARKYCFDLTQLNSESADGWQSGYEKYLADRTRSSYNTVKAYAVYQLCLIWNQQAKKYCPEFDQYAYSYRTGVSQDFDTSKRYLGVKAMHLFQENRAVFDSFNYLKNILLRMEAQLRYPETKVRIGEYTIPGQPVLAELQFRNTDTLYYRIMQSSHRQKFYYTDQQQYVRQVLSLPMVRAVNMPLPVTNDFNRHIAYLKLDPLPAGYYYLVFSDQPFSAENKRMKMISFNVSGLTTLENGDRVYVLDRQTGQPKKGALVNAACTMKAHNGLDSTYHQLLQTNAAGYAVWKDTRTKSAEIIFQGDTIQVGSVDVRDNDNEEDVYSKDEYENLVEFFEENAEMHIYTDRSIYRPGQTVFYKAILLTKHPETGEAILMNAVNIGKGLFNKTYKKWLKESEPLLYLEDAFGKSVDSVNFKPDAFGAFSGTFKIPATAATGEWEISPDYIEKRWDNGGFRVEEYKRPSYEISIEKPSGLIEPGDTLEFTVKLRSFAGASLNQVPVEYTLTANGYIPGSPSLLRTVLFRRLLDSTEHTNNEGVIRVRYQDPLFDTATALPDTSWEFIYELEATAFDPSGEVYKKRQSIKVSSRPVTINYTGPDKIDRSALPKLSFTTRDLNAGNVQRPLRVSIYRLPAVTALKDDRKLFPADTWLYPQQALTDWFPSLIFSPERQPAASLVLSREIDPATGQSFIPDTTVLQPGRYRMEVQAFYNGKMAGQMQRLFTVYDVAQQHLPDSEGLFYHLPFNSYRPGEKIKLHSGFPASAKYLIRSLQYYSTRNKKEPTRVYQESVQAAGLQTWEWRVPKDVKGEIQFTEMLVHENKLYSYNETIYVQQEKQEEPEIIVERYRSRLQPGGSEQFSVSVRTKDPKAIAELMTVLYDASLDQLEPHQWKKPEAHRVRPLSSAWDNSINHYFYSYQVEAGLPYYETAVLQPGHPTALWWLNPKDYGYANADVMGDWSLAELTRRGYAYDTDEASPFRAGAFLSSTPGLSLASSKGLNEVVVIGYGMTSVKRDLAGSVAGVTIRGGSGLQNYAQPLIVLDGVVFEGDLAKLDPSLITAAMVLKGADASAIYGARAASGVLIISTKGAIILPGQEPPPPIPPRKNFNETAFFFPAIHAGRDGYFSFSFTMPESVTEWNWKMLAHTTKARFAYAERKLQTQLPLMIQASTPRVLYQGDRLILKHRISNLDTSKASGLFSCRLEDMVTGEDLSGSIKINGADRFDLSAKATGYIATEIRVPEGLQHPVKLVITARTGQFADAEEHILPVLSKEIFVRQSQSFAFAQADTLIQSVQLTSDARIYGMGLTIHPKRQAAILNALPYLAEYPWDCAEQLVSKIQAFGTAIQLMRTDSSVQKSFAKAKAAMDIKTDKASLPADFPQASMPWLAIGQQSVKEQEALFRILDTSRALTAIETYMDKLYALQTADKGLSWFPGGESNRWISGYVLGAFGQMKMNGLLNSPKLKDERFTRFISELIGYSDRLLTQEQSLIYPGAALDYLWQRSYWLQDYAMDSALQVRSDSILQRAWRGTDKMRLITQAVLIITSTRYYPDSHPLYRKAEDRLASIREQAVEDPVYGIRWKEIADQEELTYSGEENLRILAEAFATTKKYTAIFPGILQWILNAREGHHWSSTRSTSSVLNLLSQAGQAMQDPTIDVQITSKGNRLQVSNDLLSGSPVAFRPDSVQPAAIRVAKTETGTARGSLVWYYFTAQPQQVNPYPGLRISKTITHINPVTGERENVKSGDVLKQGDELRITLTIESNKELKYVLINDRRSSALEPLENRSEYVYGTLPHYRSVRDDGNRLFADRIPAGQHSISYDVRVVYEGTFSNGVASVSCMYRPDITAYSEPMQLKAEGSR